MKALIQRVQKASVSAHGHTISRIGHGFVVFLGIRDDDSEREARRLALKTANLRVFQDEAGKMNLSLLDVGGSALVVSQFTLYADTRKGNRPSFARAAPPDRAETLYTVYVRVLRQILGDTRVMTGSFRASMLVEIVNDGPVTIDLACHRTDGSADCGPV